MERYARIGSMAELDEIIELAKTAEELLGRQAPHEG